MVSMIIWEIYHGKITLEGIFCFLRPVTVYILTISLLQSCFSRFFIFQTWEGFFRNCYYLAERLSWKIGTRGCCEPLPSGSRIDAWWEFGGKVSRKILEFRHIIHLWKRQLEIRKNMNMNRKKDTAMVLFLFLTSKSLHSLRPNI